MNPDPSLFNRDLAPIPAGKRTWGMYNYVSLWVATSVCIPSYMLASSLIAGSMNWWQAIGTILLGNLIVRLGPACCSTRTRGPSTVFRFQCWCEHRSASEARTFRPCYARWWACGWFGIQTWIGGAGHPFHAAGFSGRRRLQGRAWFDYFGAFWLLNMLVIWKGIDTIRFLEGIGAPFMLGVALLLLWWITRKAGGFGPVLSTPAKFQTGAAFFHFFVPSLTAMVGFWATVALEHPRFHALSDDPARAGVGSGHWVDDGDDAVFVCGSGGNLGFGSFVRRSGVGPSGTDRAISSTADRVRGSDRDSDRHSQYQCCRQCGFALKRLFESQSTPGFRSAPAESLPELSE